MKVTTLGLIPLGVLVAADMRSPADIGVAVTRSPIEVDHRLTPGNATLFEGSAIETLTDGSMLLLKGNLRIDLDAGTKGAIYQDHFVLESGTARGNVHGDFAIDFGGVRIRPTTGSATVILRRTAKATGMTVEDGQMSVSGGSGVLLARLEAKDSVNLQVNENASKTSGEVQLTGLLTKKDNYYLLIDRTTHISQRLTGDVPAKDVGRVVTVIGEIKLNEVPPTGVDRVVEIKHVGPAGSYVCTTGGDVEQRRIVLSGALRIENGHFLLTDTKSGVISELRGSLDKSWVGRTITVKGHDNDRETPYKGAEQIVDVDAFGDGAGAYISACSKAWIGTAVIAAAPAIVAIATLGGGGSVPISH